MSQVYASCPGCGARLSFQYAGGVVVVCQQCQSAVARTDLAFQDLGKVSRISRSESRLALGVSGSYQSIPFTLCGRVQVRHQNAFWDEWYLAFSDGRWGWLAEAQGKFYLTFQSPPSPLPTYHSLVPGNRISIPPIQEPFVIAEKGEAELLGAEGEIPYRIQPGARYFYADLSGPHGEFGTLDYRSTSPTLFLGREFSLAQLGIDLSSLAPPVEQEVSAERLGCPNCGASLELQAPDKTERVSCVYCSSLLDVNQGALVFLQKLDRQGREPKIPLGSVGNFEEHPFRAIGFLVRSVLVEGERYSWIEYLLYHAQLGFRWLIFNEGHWIYVKSISPGEVSGSGTSATYQEKTYQLSENNHARVDFVLGEFYWKVEVGQTVEVRDFINKPYVISREKNDKEVVWSHGTYIEQSQVEEAFGISLPKPIAKQFTQMPFHSSQESSQQWVGLIIVGVFLLIVFLYVFLGSGSSGGSGGVYYGVGSSGFRGGK